MSALDTLAQRFSNWDPPCLGVREKVWLPKVFTFLNVLQYSIQNMQTNVTRCTDTRQVLKGISIVTSLKQHAIRAHSLFRSLSGCLHALITRAGLPSSHTCNRQPSLTASDLRGDMASWAGALADRPRLVLKKISEIWNYFGYEADSEGKPIDTQRPVCKTCFKATQAKGGNT